MKKLLLVLLLACSAVRAQPYLSAKNEGGGEIVLTSYTVSTCAEGLKAMYTMLPTGRVYHGCWAYINEKAHVKYDDGERRVYPIEYFTVKGEK
jgi:hypothetical protein